MEEFPSNSRRPTRREAARDKDEPKKKVERVATGRVRQRNVPLGKRMSQYLLGGENVQSIWGFMFGEVMIPAARDTIAEALTGGIERAIFPDSRGRGGRARTRYSGSPSHTPYNRMHSRDRDREEPRRDMSRRARATHDFKEIILSSRVEAEEVLDRLDDLCDKYDGASVADLYEMVGISGNYTDDRWGWVDVRSATVQRVRDGYLLNLPRPEQLD